MEDEVVKEIAKNMEHGNDYFTLEDDTQCMVRRIGKKPNMVVCGGGHVSQAVIKLAKLLDFTVTCIEDRAEFADKALEAGADFVCNGDYDEELRGIENNQDTYLVVVTRAHSYDLSSVLEISKKPHAYVGMIGSKRHVQFVKDDLREAVVEENFIENLHSPIGLKIGAQTPAEIGVAIVAEIIACKNTSMQKISLPIDTVETILKADERVCLSTIIQKRGSSPCGVGASMVVLPNGSIVGAQGAEQSVKSVFGTFDTLIYRRKGNKYVSFRARKTS